MIRYGTIWYDLILDSQIANYCLYLQTMEKHEVKAIAMLNDINKILCISCISDKTNVQLAIMQCKEQRNTLYRHNQIHGKTNEFETLEQVIFWDKVKEYLKALL